MADKKDLTGGAGGAIPKGGNSADVRARFKVDTTQLDKLAEGIKKIRTDFAWLNTNLKNINSGLDTTLQKLKQISQLDTSNLSGAGGGGGGGYMNPLLSSALTKVDARTIQANQTDQSTKIVNVYGYPGGDGGPGGSGGAAAGGGVSRVAQYATQAVQTLIAATDSRINGMYGKMQSADKLGVYYQQQMGISQSQYQSGMRQPLTGYRTGEGSVNQLLALQAATGIQAQGQIKGMEALRTVSGFSLSSGDLAGMAQTLGSAQVNNRMTMMLGTGLYGPGGKQRSMDQVIKMAAQNSGLMGAQGERVLEGARQDGSVTRTRLASMGMGTDIQNLVFDYAQSANTFQKKTGGKMGAYDPTNRAHTRIMGVEDNFATQAEETTARKGSRDEQFYKDQADNYAKMEKNLQAATDALAKFEHSLRGIIGARAGSKIIGKGSIGSKVLGGLMIGGGALLGAATSWTGVGAVAGMGIIGAGSAMMSGDGSMPAGNTMVPSGFGGKKTSFSAAQNRPSVTGLNSKFKERLFRMMADNPNVGIGEGSRTEATQRQLFLSRYKKVTDGGKGDVEWEGAQWKRVSGAPATPPGHSMHELGLAADLVGDLKWVQENASRYGLKTFESVNGEPWHVQPAELPNSRWEYEKGGSEWGMPSGATRGAIAIDPNTGQPIGASTMGDAYQQAGGNGGKIQSFSTYQGMSIGEQLGAIHEQNQTFKPTGQSRSASSNVHVSTQAASGSQTSAAPAGAMDPQELAKLLYKRGFRGKHLVNMLAIAGRESNWKPTAHNGKPPDDSYGLFQINMLGKLGPARMKQFNISNYDQLFDPETNVKAAWILSGGKSENLTPWGIKGNALAKTGDWMPKAQAAAKSAGVDRGDPMPMPSRGGGGQSLTVGGNTTINISPNIHLSSNGGNTEQEARRMAQQIAKLLETEMKKQSMRTL
jgi:hypothetical protein